MHRAIIAAGHGATADAAAEVIGAGGSAFDGACAALAAACVAEPVLASLGGGGFLMARPAGGAPLLFDFFVQTPRRRPANADGIDFYPILIDFGDTTQEFHIGLGSVAVPGAVAGLFALQRALCRLPVSDLLAPAERLARDGVVVTAYQHRLARVVEPILRATPESFALYASPQVPDRLAAPGERVRQPALAEALAALVGHGEGLLYGGERSAGAWGQRLAAACAGGGGLLGEDDLAGYRVERRAPLALDYRDARLHLNPPPSFGGVLIALALELLAAAGPPAGAFGSSAQRQRLASAMRLAQEARGEASLQGLAPALVRRYRRLMRAAVRARRGTTQISLADADGNLASLTLSNGGGAGRVLGGTGIALNNMLGESDLNPHGFHRWPSDRRIGSMMCPSLIEHGGGRWTVTGSAGSNRIRSAVLQVIHNLVDLGMPLTEAVEAPRLHVEGELLSIEPPAAAEVLAHLRRDWPALHAWSQRSVFFGGAHSVARDADGRLSGAGDSRRGGVVRAL